MADTSKSFNVALDEAVARMACILERKASYAEVKASCAKLEKLNTALSANKSQLQGENQALKQKLNEQDDGIFELELKYKSKCLENMSAVNDLNKLSSEKQVNDAALKILRVATEQHTNNIEKQTNEIKSLYNEATKAAGISMAQCREINRQNGKLHEKNCEIDHLKMRLAETENAHFNDELQWNERYASLEKANDELYEKFSAAQRDNEQLLADIKLLQEKLRNETGINIIDSSDITFVETHFNNDTDNATLAEHDDSSDPGSLTLPFPINDEDLMRPATREELSGLIDPELLKKQDNTVRGYFEDVIKTVSEASEGEWEVLDSK